MLVFRLWRQGLAGAAADPILDIISNLDTFAVHVAFGLVHDDFPYRCLVYLLSVPAYGHSSSVVDLEGWDPLIRQQPSIIYFPFDRTSLFEHAVPDTKFEAG